MILRMWLDPELRRELTHLREMVSLRHQTPTREWPLIFAGDKQELLVIREWPNGSLTAYLTAEYTDRLKDEL